MMTKQVFALALAALLYGCTALSPYHIEVQQGNLVTPEMVAKLKPGMTPSQVRYVLGTPLIVDPFHANRWDYAYSLNKQGVQQEPKHITLLFEDEKLKSIEGASLTEAKPEEAAKP